ncbi:hypothetical protein EST38_g12233 [Candolleomyces aberdarensis]|uniref:NACHT domain-containing protein n=1 Tax=Candolleomyces aberdarensis TaxID=2316362 RepID=A0A4Q2D5I8_9AGAR|nr:hypothetical protein EST38_g12233 [Candolleomyces aberdarensis]
MVLNKALEVQLMKLIVEPFQSLGELDDMPHRLVIIDGLDECINSDQQSRVEKQYAEDQERVQVRVLDLILALHSRHLPLCFLILSRPEPWIKQHIGSKAFQHAAETLDLYEVGDHMKDVGKFVRDELARIAERLDPQPGDEEVWPGYYTVEVFLGRTGGHILYAATVIRHIDDPYDDPRQRLQDILHIKFNSTQDLTYSTPFSSLHELYRQILRSCPQANRATMVGVLEEILAVRFCFMLERQIHHVLNILDRLSGRAPGRGIKALRPLHAVIRLSGNDDASSSFSPFFYHSSFANFLEDQSQPLPDVTINVQKGLKRVLAGCLKALSAVTMDGQVCDEHIKFSLNKWPILWSQWEPIADADQSSYLKALLATDLTACFARSMMHHGTPDGLLFCLPGLYNSTRTNIVTDKPFSVCPTLVEDVLSHLQSSVNACFLHVLNPEWFTSRRTNPRLVSIHLYVYMCEILKHHPVPAFDNVVQALRGLLETQEKFFKELEEEVEEQVMMPSLNDEDEESEPAVMGMFKLVRQVVE